jgi:hypothetical protein
MFLFLFPLTPLFSLWRLPTFSLLYTDWNKQTAFLINFTIAFTEFFESCLNSSAAGHKNGGNLQDYFSGNILLACKS